jgi:pentatricopeptide repeat protein
MARAGVAADVVTCCSLINALERGGQVALAEALFLKMCAAGELAGAAGGLGGADGNGADGGGGAEGGAGKGAAPRARTHPSPTSVLALLGASAGGDAGGEGGLWGADGGRALLASLGIEAAKGGGGGGGGAAAAEGGDRVVADLSSAFARAAVDGGEPSRGAPPPLEIGAPPLPSLPPPRSLARAASAAASTLNAAAAAFPGVAEGSARAAALAGGPAAALAGAYGASAGPSRLQRSGSLRAGAAAPPAAQAAAAAQLRRAISCFPSVDADASDADAGSASAGAASSAAGLTAMFNFSHAARVAPNRVCCNALLAAYARARPPLWQKALTLLGAMWAGGAALAPDVVSVNTACKCCCAAFQLGKAFDLVTDMAARGLAPNATTLNCLISAAADAGHAGALGRAGEWLDAAPAEVQAACGNALLACLVRAGAYTPARARFAAMLAPGAPAPPNAGSFAAMLSAHARAGDHAAVRSAFAAMLARGVPPTLSAYNALLATLAAQGAWAEAVDALGAALAAGESTAGPAPGAATYNAALAALARGAATAPPDQHALIAARALQVFQLMRAAGGPAAPDGFTFQVGNGGAFFLPFLLSCFLSHFLLTPRPTASTSRRSRARSRRRATTARSSRSPT